MYEVVAERPRGRFGVLTRRTSLGQIREGQTETFGNGSNMIELTLYPQLLSQLGKTQLK